MAEPFRIRRGAPADIPVIAHHRLGMFTEMAFGDPADYEAYASEFQSFAAREMAAGRFLSWLAETSEGEIVGGGAVLIVPWPANPKHRKQQRAFLLNVFTEPAFRRQGIARSLVQTMADWCRGQGFGSVFLHASDAGRPLYQAMGFHPTTELRFDFLTMIIGVLALQGDFEEHIHKLSGINVPAAEVRLPADLDGLSGLIIPGGETTTFRNLALAFGMTGPLREFGKHHALWGTCAGAIALARDIGREQSLLGLMDISVERNAFGRQLNSFEIDLEIPALPAADPNPFHAVFIRAPAIVRAGTGVEVLARLPDGTIVAARQKNFLATCFHPELTADNRLHRLFLDMVGAAG